jgi:hypothetical protein
LELDGWSQRSFYGHATDVIKRDEVERSPHNCGKSRMFDHDFCRRWAALYSKTSMDTNSIERQTPFTLEIAVAHEHYFNS